MTVCVRLYSFFLTLNYQLSGTGSTSVRQEELLLDAAANGDDERVVDYLNQGVNIECRGQVSI